MAQCKWCENKGLFLSVNSTGLCKRCEPPISMDFNQRGKIIYESIQLAATGKKIDTRLSRNKLILEQAEALRKYEEKGIDRMSPKPSELIEKFTSYHDEIIFEEMESIADKSLTKANVMPTAKQAVTEATKALVKIKEWRESLLNLERLEDLECQVVDFIQQKQLAEILDQANKAEFKGQKKKALDQYQEALYFLSKEDVSDSLKSEHVEGIKASIETLTSE